MHRCFGRSLVNLADAIRLSDRVRILDNSDKRRRRLLKIDKGLVRAVSRTMPEWAKAAIGVWVAAEQETDIVPYFARGLVADRLLDGFV